MANAHLPIWQPTTRRDYQLQELLEDGEPIADPRLIPSAIDMIERELAHSQELSADLERRLAELKVFFDNDGTASSDYRAPLSAFKAMSCLEVYADEYLPHLIYRLSATARAIRLLAYSDSQPEQ